MNRRSGPVGTEPHSAVEETATRCAQRPAAGLADRLQGHSSGSRLQGFRGPRVRLPGNGWLAAAEPDDAHNRYGIEPWGASGGGRTLWCRVSNRYRAGIGRIKS